MLNRSNEIGSTNVTFFCIYLISFKDISECDEETLATHHNSYAHICHADANCTNTKGSFYCTCHTGYSGDGFICTGINKTHALCRLLWYLSANLNIIIAFFTVSDVNECSPDQLSVEYQDLSHNCHPDANCTNTKGSFYCTCLTGYFGNGVICQGTFCRGIFQLDHYWESSMMLVDYRDCGRSIS